MDYLNTIQNCKACHLSSMKKNFKLCKHCSAAIDQMKQTAEVVEETVMKGFRISFSVIILKYDNNDYGVEINGMTFHSRFTSINEARDSIANFAMS